MSSPDNRPSLTDPQVVEKILVGIAREAVGCRIAAAKGIIREEDANTIEEKEIENRARIFLNRDKAYAVNAQWNKPGAIDVFLAKALYLEVRGPEPIVKAALARYILNIRSRLNLAANPDVSEQEWKDKIQDILKGYVDLFMGIARSNITARDTTVAPKPEEKPVEVAPTFLGQAQVVEKILLGLARESLNAHRAVVSNFITIQDAAHIEEKEIDVCARIFLGRDKNYSVDPAWNKPGVLDAYLAKELQIGTRGPENIIKEALAMFLVQVRQHFDVGQHPNFTEADWKVEVQDDILRFCSLLLGEKASKPSAAPVTAPAVPVAPVAQASGPAAPGWVSTPTPKSETVFITKPFLGDPQVVEKVLVTLATDIAQTRVALAKKKLTETEAEESIEKEITNHTKIFLGNDHAYAPDATWNVAGGLDSFLTKQLSLDPDDGSQKALKTALLKFVDEVWQKSNLAVNPDASETEWRPKAQRVFTKYTNLFVGLLPEPDVVEVAPVPAPVPVVETLAAKPAPVVEAPKSAPSPVVPVVPAPKPVEPAKPVVVEKPVVKEKPVEQPKVAKEQAPVKPVPAKPALAPAPAPAKPAQKKAPVPVEAPREMAAVAEATGLEEVAGRKERRGGSWKWAWVLLLLAIIVVLVSYLRIPTRQPAPPVAEHKPVKKEKPPQKFYALKNGRIIAMHKGVDGKLVEEEVKSQQASKASGQPGQPSNEPADEVRGDRPIQFWYDLNTTSGTARFLVATEADREFQPRFDAPEAWDLWLTDETGKEKRVAKSVFRAKFSPDGKNIAYTTSDCVMHVIDLDGKELASTDRAYEPNWNKDGSAIVFEHVVEGRELYPAEALQLARYNWKDNKVEILSDGGFDDLIPHFHPSGDWILYVSGKRTGGAAFWKVPATGGEAVQLTNIHFNEGGNSFTPTPYQTTMWSENGRWFVFDYKMEGSEQTWGLEFDEKGNFKRSVKLADGLSPQWTGPNSFVSQKRAGEGFELVQENLPGS